MKLAIVGSRTFSDYKLLKKEINDMNIEVDEIVSGGAIGADSLAEIYAKEYNMKMTIFKPEWNVYGRRAGFIRNKLIIDNCDCMIAFWNGTSKGTLSSINYARSVNKYFKIVYI